MCTVLLLQQDLLVLIRFASCVASSVDGAQSWPFWAERDEVRTALWNHVSVVVVVMQDPPPHHPHRADPPVTWQYHMIT